MKHHDSIVQADKKLSLAIEQLKLWHLPATPVNYAVTYEYISQQNQNLFSAIKQYLASGKAIDNFFMEEIYQEYILGHKIFREEILTDLDNLATSVEQHTAKSSQSTDRFVDKLDDNIAQINTGNQRQINSALNKLKKDAIQFKLDQQSLADQLRRSQRQASNLRSELEDVRKEIYFDSLTQLYNRKAMAQHLEAWYIDNPNTQVAALVINIDNFANFRQRFGPLLGDIMLTKIAGKVSSYVTQSGLPIRSGGDEFLILLPDMNASTANEVAEKIRQGVEKLRFVNSKSGVRLPKTTISIGVSQFKITKNVNAIVKHARRVFQSLKRPVENQVLLANP